ncbi:hypothetical protein R5031_06495 [Pseudomonas aeruginosa]|uniref:hypothetical protein n=1 Tax=Pseudomonas TaxID=286 RepID=UPI001F496568|nr:hypothetical protein [Pseudomonas aeruginosa]WOU21235.1 hypothetical protein R5031_06495 [Pseudomonas aeruginosa]WOU34753.1 hypothetical protein R5027_11655 [Pseudomonas aeruginosa]
MSTAVTSRAKPIVISVISLVVVFGLLYAWRTTRSGGADHQAMPPMPVSTLRAAPAAWPTNYRQSAACKRYVKCCWLPTRPGA